MGGDDLGSDDEVWMAQPVTDKDSPPSTQQEDASDDGNGKKRKRDRTDTNNGEDPESVGQVKKKSKSPAKILIEMGREIDQKSVEQQATFLSTCLKHYGLLASSEKASDDDDDSDANIMLPRYFATSSKGRSLLERLKHAMPPKRIKNWKNRESPLIVIVCISARRAVEILKQLSHLRARVAKLFPKNGTVAEQRERLLAAPPCPIAVGTPHRLKALAEASSSSSSPGEKKTALSFVKTQLVILDGHVSNKQYTVCTLPDTVPPCMELLQESILPELRRRKDIHLAFF